MKTLYEFATEKMQESIQHYFEIVEKTNNFLDFDIELFEDPHARQMVLAGKSLEYKDLTPEQCLDAVSRVGAVMFDIEKGVSAYVYENSREYISLLISKASEVSGEFSNITPETVKDNAYLLPIWQAALNIASKANLKTIFGSASDQNISGPSSIKISDYANDYFSKNTINIIQIKDRTERTLEGIIRDLVGRLLYEAVVKDALESEGVPFKAEEEYSGIAGVVYKFRSDFVIPDEENPLAFIEVRKSSSRHASLYAKDKMFSAINWKGKYKNMLGIVVAEGEWTNESLITMSKVFDYVVPVSKSRELAKNINKYLNGDKSILRWIIDFEIHKNEID